jgi:hypothetical protein
MVDAARARKLAERIKVLVAEALERAVKDPDLGTQPSTTPFMVRPKIRNVARQSLSAIAALFAARWATS